MAVSSETLTELRELHRVMDPRTVLADASTPFGIEMGAAGKNSGPAGRRIDLAHIGPNADPLAALDQVWHRLSGRAAVVLEGGKTAQAERAARAYATASGAALFRHEAAGLLLLTEHAGHRKTALDRGWSPLAEPRAPAAKHPGRRERLVFRSTPPHISDTRVSGDTPDAVDAAWRQYSQMRFTGHVMRYTYADAVVLGDMTIYGQRRIVREMRRLISVKHSQETMANTHVASLPSSDRALAIGGSTHTNYYHWMTESLYSLWLARHNPLDRRLLALAPILDGYQLETLSLLGLESGVEQLAPGGGRRVQNLTVLSPLFGEHSWNTHRTLLTMFDDLLDAAVRQDGPLRPPYRKLFISRADSPSRPQANEEEVATALESRGFEIVTLTGLSLAQQARMFAEAAMVVGPHGAGLTNIGFLRPGARVFEMTPGHYLNGCFLAISRAAGLAHHIHVGTSLGSTPLRHKRSWRVEPDRVLAEVDGLLAA